MVIRGDHMTSSWLTLLLAEMENYVESRAGIRSRAPGVLLADSASVPRARSSPGREVRLRQVRAGETHPSACARVS